MTSNNKTDSTNNGLYHNAYILLKNYRDVVWGLEVSVNRAKHLFQKEYGSSVDEFLDSVYNAGADLSGTEIEHQAKCIERNRKMLQLIDAAVDTMRHKHKHGEVYYWILYYSFLCPHSFENTDQIIDTLASQVVDISYRTYYKKRKLAIEAFATILWGYTSCESAGLLNDFIPEDIEER